MAKGKKIGVAVIGSGSIATHRHAPEYSAHPDVEIRAFVDRVPERAEKLMEHRASPFLELLEKENLFIPAGALVYYGHWITQPGRSHPTSEMPHPRPRFRRRGWRARTGPAGFTRRSGTSSRRESRCG